MRSISNVSEHKKYEIEVGTIYVKCNNKKRTHKVVHSNAIANHNFVVVIIENITASKVVQDCARSELEGEAL
jgi:hypothetical protein